MTLHRRAELETGLLHAGSNGAALAVVAELPGQ